MSKDTLLIITIGAGVYLLLQAPVASAAPAPVYTVPISPSEPELSDYYDDFKNWWQGLFE